MQKQKKPFYKDWRSYVAGGLVILGTAGYGLRDKIYNLFEPELEKEPTFSQTRPHHIDLTGETISKSPKKREKNIEFHEIKTPFGKLYPTPADLGLEKEFEEVEEAKKQGKQGKYSEKIMKLAGKIFDIQRPWARKQDEELAKILPPEKREEYLRECGDKKSFLQDFYNEFVRKWPKRQRTLKEKVAQAGVNDFVQYVSDYSNGIKIEYHEPAITSKKLEKNFIKVLKILADVYYDAETFYVSGTAPGTLNNFNATIKCDVIKKNKNDAELMENIKHKIKGATLPKPGWFIENRYGTTISEEELAEIYHGRKPKYTTKKINGLFSNWDRLVRQRAEAKRKEDEWNKKYPHWFPRSIIPSWAGKEEDIFELKNKLDETGVEVEDISFSSSTEDQICISYFSDAEPEEIDDKLLAVLRATAKEIPNAKSIWVCGEEDWFIRIKSKEPLNERTERTSRGGDMFRATIPRNDITTSKNDTELFEKIKNKIKNPLHEEIKPQWLYELELRRKLTRREYSKMGY